MPTKIRSRLQISRNTTLLSVMFIINAVIVLVTPPRATILPTIVAVQISSAIVRDDIADFLTV